MTQWNAWTEDANDVSAQAGYVGRVVQRGPRTRSAGGSVEPCSRPWEGSSKTSQAPSSSGYKNTRNNVYCIGVGANAGMRCTALCEETPCSKLYRAQRTYDWAGGRRWIEYCGNVPGREKGS